MFASELTWQQVIDLCAAREDADSGVSYDPEVLYSLISNDLGDVDLARISRAAVESYLEAANTLDPGNWSPEVFDSYLDEQRAAADTRAQAWSVEL